MNKVRAICLSIVNGWRQIQLDQKERWKARQQKRREEELHRQFLEDTYKILEEVRKVEKDYIHLFPPTDDDDSQGPGEYGRSSDL